jgi:hypothetical protein
MVSIYVRSLCIGGVSIGGIGVFIVLIRVMSPLLCLGERDC